MATPTTPSLFGLGKNNSNKDFSKPDAWGKNQFNCSFPVSLSCYAYSKGIKPVYLTLDNKMKVSKSKISVAEVFGLEPLSEYLFFAFESDFTPCRTMVVNRLERIDLVTMNTQNMQNQCLRPIEIKLTALPDNTTADLSENKYGSEIVVRSPTIIYLALSIAMTCEKEKGYLRDQLAKVFGRNVDWTDFGEVRPFIKDLAEAIDNILKSKMSKQSPFMLQPIWKTEGKTLRLDDNCFDIFVWSDFAFTRLFMGNLNDGREKSNTRKMRTIVWLSKMLHDYAVNGKIDFRQVIDNYTYDTKNDKAFAMSGNLTNPYMACDELTIPRISKFEIKNIILGGGEKFLSPERRLDAAILASRDLFQ